MLKYFWRAVLILLLGTYVAIALAYPVPVIIWATLSAIAVKTVRFHV
jgi:hypothetical protein